MKRYYPYIMYGVLYGGIISIVVSPLSVVAKILAAVLLWHVVYDYDFKYGTVRRLDRLEGANGLEQIKQIQYEQEEELPASCIVEYQVVPHWPKVFRCLVPQMTDEDHTAILNHLYEHAGEKRSDYRTEAIGQRFSFTRILGGTSGVDILWSSFHKDFVKDTDIPFSPIDFLHDVLGKERARSLFSASRNLVRPPAKIGPDGLTWYDDSTTDAGGFPIPTRLDGAECSTFEWLLLALASDVDSSHHENLILELPESVSRRFEEGRIRWCPIVRGVEVSPKEDEDNFTVLRDYESDSTRRLGVRMASVIPRVEAYKIECQTYECYVSVRRCRGQRFPVADWETYVLRNRE